VCSLAAGEDQRGQTTTRHGGGRGLVLAPERLAMGFACAVWQAEGAGMNMGTDQRISGSAVDGSPTEEPRPDANNARSQRPAPEGHGVPACALACYVGTPVVAHRHLFQHVPWSSILCGCINKFLYRQANAVWGRYPTACTMYVTKKLGVCDVVLSLSVGGDAQCQC
jgi:hypothetical protein